LEACESAWTILVEIVVGWMNELIERCLLMRWGPLVVVWDGVDWIDAGGLVEQSIKLKEI
jgi:hypothetical protein